MFLYPRTVSPSLCSWQCHALEFDASLSVLLQPPGAQLCGLKPMARAPARAGSRLQARPSARPLPAQQPREATPARGQSRLGWTRRSAPSRHSSRPRPGRPLSKRSRRGRKQRPGAPLRWGVLRGSRVRQQQSHSLAATHARAPRGTGQASWRSMLQSSQALEQGLAVMSTQTLQARPPPGRPRRRRGRGRPHPPWADVAARIGPRSNPAAALPVARTGASPPGSAPTRRQTGRV